MNNQHFHNAQQQQYSSIPSNHRHSNPMQQHPQIFQAQAFQQFHHPSQYQAQPSFPLPQNSMWPYGQNIQYYQQQQMYSQNPYQYQQTMPFNPPSKDSEIIKQELDDATVRQKEDPNEGEDMNSKGSEESSNSAIQKEENQESQTNQEKNNFVRDFKIEMLNKGISQQKLMTVALELCMEKCSNDEIRDFFEKYLARNDTKNKQFSYEEDQLIIDSINKFGRDWTLIEKAFKGRSKIVLKNRYYYLNKKGIVDRIKNDWVYGPGVYAPLESEESQNQEDNQEAVSVKKKVKK